MKAKCYLLVFLLASLLRADLFSEAQKAAMKKAHIQPPTKEEKVKKTSSDNVAENLLNKLKSLAKKKKNAKSVLYEHDFNNNRAILSIFYQHQNKKYKKLLLLKNALDKSIVNFNYKQTIKILKKIYNMDINKKIKEKFFDYSFWQIIYNYDNVFLTPPQKQKVYEVLEKIVGLMDTSYNIETMEDNDVLQLMLGRSLSPTNLLSLLQSYYPYGINNDKIYLKFFKLFSTNLVKQNLAIRVIFYLKKDFLNYFNTTDTINSQTLDYFLKMLSKNGQLNDFRVLNAVKRLKTLNPLDSNVYYYLAIFNKNNPKKYQKLLETAIKYNVYNVPAWKALINFFLKERLVLFNIQKKTLGLENYDNRIFKLIDYVLNNVQLTPKQTKYFLTLKAKLYYFEGANWKDFNLLLKAAQIYYSLGNYDLTKQILSYIIGINLALKPQLQKEFPKVYQ